VDAYEVSGHASGYAKALAGIVEAFHSLTTVQDIPWRHRRPPARPGQAVTQARQEIHHHSKEEEEEEEKKKKEKIKMKCTATQGATHLRSALHLLSCAPAYSIITTVGTSSHS